MSIYEYMIMYDYILVYMSTYTQIQDHCMIFCCYSYYHSVEKTMQYALSNEDLEIKVLKSRGLFFAQF